MLMRQGAGAVSPDLSRKTAKEGKAHLRRKRPSSYWLPEYYSQEELLQQSKRRRAGCSQATLSHEAWAPIQCQQYQVC